MSSDPNSKNSSISTLEKVVFSFAIFVACLGFAAAGAVLLDVLLYG